MWSSWTYLHLLQHSVGQCRGEVVLFTFHALWFADVNHAGRTSLIVAAHTHSNSNESLGVTLVVLIHTSSHTAGDWMYCNTSGIVRVWEKRHSPLLPQVLGHPTPLRERTKSRACNKPVRLPAHTLPVHSLCMTGVHWEARQTYSSKENTFLAIYCFLRALYYHSKPDKPVLLCRKLKLWRIAHAQSKITCKKKGF